MFQKGYVSKAQQIADDLRCKKANVRAGAGPEQAEGARGLHQGEDDQGAGERGREGPVRRAGQGGDLEPGEDEGGEAREADRELQALRPRRRPGRLRQRPEPVRWQQPAADRGGGDRPRAAEDLQPARHQQDAGQHQGPRVDDRPAHDGPQRPDPGRRLRRPGPDRHRRVGGPPARPEQLLQLGRQGLHHARLDRAGPLRAPAGDDGARSRSWSTELRRRPERPGPGGPRVQGQGPRRRQDRRRPRLEGRPARDLQRQARRGHARGSRPARSSRSTRSR